MIPARSAPILFGFILSGLMSGIVAGITTVRLMDPALPFFGQWFGAWMSGWMIAFPAVLVVAPITRRIVAKVTRPD